MSLAVFLGVVLWSQVCAAAVSTPFFRKGYEYNAELQNFYKLQVTGANWTAANHRCKLEGATLAVAENKQEADFLLRLVHANTEIRANSAVYTGLQDILSQGVFTTSEGVLIEQVYQRWAKGQPDNGDDDSDSHCVALDDKGFLNVVECDTILPYVCKKTLKTLQWNEACQLPDLDYKYDARTNKCYKFHLSPQTWTEAFKVCVAEDSYLAVINSNKEAEVIANITNDAPKDNVTGDYLAGAILLGFHNKFEEGFETIFGQSLEAAGYSLWPPGWPDSANGPELCGSMFYELEKNTTTVYLNDIGCDAWNCFFICEHDIYTQQKIDNRLLNEV